MLVLRPSDLRQHLERDGLQVDSLPPDPEERKESSHYDSSVPYSRTSIRPSYNIAPTYIEPIYRAVVDSTNCIRYELIAARWGLIPSWTPKPNESASFSATLKTINCRDDSLAQNTGLWNNIKHTKRCIIPAQGFYEWLTRGNDKVSKFHLHHGISRYQYTAATDQLQQPHYVKPKDPNSLFYFAGLWDQSDGIYSFTIITTSSNSELQFLHNRMPVILRGADTVKAWLDPTTTHWGPELQTMLQPLEDGEIMVYPVPKEVGKVGRSESWFIEPLADRRGGIESFFKKTAGMKRERTEKEDQDTESVKTSLEDDNTAKRKMIKVANDTASTEASITTSPMKKHTDPTGKLKGGMKGIKLKSGGKQTLSPKKQDTKTSTKDQGNTKITSFFGTKGVSGKTEK